VPSLEGLLLLDIGPMRGLLDFTIGNNRGDRTMPFSVHCQLGDRN
jgi:hypothetical protein